MSRFPFGTPRSWYVVAYSDELAPGTLKRIQYFGREMVVFRGQNGTAATLDAYCPHLGAHLGIGGKVVGDTLSCPFHGWQWGLEGSCEAIPYSDRIPANARVGTYPTVERHGMVYVWFDKDARPPDFEIPEIAEWGQPGWLSSWLRWEWTLATHPQEMAENGIDWPHFGTVHAMEMPTDRGHAFHPHHYTWQVGGTKAVSTLAGLHDQLMMYGENWGMGYSWLRQHGEFETIVASGMTPIDEETTHVRMGVIARFGDGLESEARAEVEAYMAEHAVFAEQDFAIWENKKFRAKPPLCEEDGPIAAYRQWASQFY